MVGDVAADQLTCRYGPAGFAAALVNILVVDFVTWIFLPWLYLAILVLPLLLVDLAISVVLAVRAGTLGQIGRGMLIGCLSAPLSLIIFIPGFLAAAGIGVI